jgi:hypothetical protein
MRFLRSIFLCFSLLTALYGFSQSATFTTIPAAVNGTINVCAGSTILFNSTVNPATLAAPEFIRGILVITKHQACLALLESPILRQERIQSPTI